MQEKTANEKAIQLVSNRPAGARKAVIFSCDQGYVPFAAHAAQQISDLAPDKDFDICICSGKQAITLPDSLSALNLRICHIDVGDRFEGLRLDKGRSHDAYYLRIAFPQVFASDYDRILYLDSDIFVQGGDFSALLELDIGDHALAAVRDNIQWRTPSRQVKRNKLPGVKDGPYFNSGMMLMDVKRCVEIDLLDQCISFGRKHARVLKRHDQNLLNAVMNGSWAELSPMWNWQFSWSARLFATLVSPHVIHFIGPAKPWKDTRAQFEPRFAQSYRRFAAVHFPEFPFDLPVMPRLAPDSRYFTKTLVKHFLSRRKMARYLARFPTDLTVYK